MIVLVNEGNVECSVSGYGRLDAEEVSEVCAHVKVCVVLRLSTTAMDIDPSREELAASSASLLS